MYGAGNKIDGAFLSDTQSVLHSLAEVSRELEVVLNARFDNSVGGLSRMSTHITLSYHHVSLPASLRKQQNLTWIQCIVLTTRPLVMCILETTLGISIETNETNHVSLSPPIAALLQTCIDSATAILKMLRALAEHDLLGERILTATR